MSNTPHAIALGFFDGVHIAHKKIIAAAAEYGKTNNIPAIALSFDISPLEILSPKRVKYLTTLKEKEELISSLGAAAEFLPLSRDFLNMGAEDFIKKVLIEKYNVKYAVCGYNYRFGKGGSGDTSMLSEYGKKYGFQVKVMDCETALGDAVSSSRIRKLIADGNISEANKLLGRNFSVTGTVCEGKKLGRTLGFPTANVFPSHLTVIPKNGVYKTRVFADGKSYNAITNTGTNPTVGGERLRTETYIPHESLNLYGKEIKIEFIDFIRAERKFESTDDLKKQIETDLKLL